MTIIQIELNPEQLQKLQKHIDSANNATTLTDKLFYIGYCYGFTEFTDHTIDYDDNRAIIAVKKADIIKRYNLKRAEAKQC